MQLDSQLILRMSVCVVVQQFQMTVYMHNQRLASRWVAVELEAAGWYMRIELIGGLALQVSVRLSNAFNEFRFRAPQTELDCNYKIDKQGVVYEHLLVHMRTDHHGVDLFGTLNSDQTVISWGTTPVTYWYSPKPNNSNTAQNQLLLQQPELI